MLFTRAHVRAYGILRDRDSGFALSSFLHELPLQLFCGQGCARLRTFKRMEFAGFIGVWGLPSTSTILQPLTRKPYQI